MSQRILPVLAGLLVLAGVMVGVGGWGRTVGAGTSTATAVRALTDHPPADFTGRPDGCSSPIGGSPYRFGDACARHDVGYDLLRYEADRGRPLGPDARRAIDDAFARQMRAGCHDPGCRLMAGLYAGAVRLNSWRQGYGVPRPETPLELGGPVVAGWVAGGLVLVLLRRPVRRPRELAPVSRPIVVAGAR